MCSLGQRSDVQLGKKASPGSGEPESQATPMRTVSSRMKNLMRDELLINVRKFEIQVLFKSQVEHQQYQILPA